jgi:hypothetical protein
MVKILGGLNFKPQNILLSETGKDGAGKPENTKTTRCIPVSYILFFNFIILFAQLNKRGHNSGWKTKTRNLAFSTFINFRIPYPFAWLSV